MIVPNEGRVIVELIKEKQGQIFMPGSDNAKAGENLYIGRIVAPGTSVFKKGQIVMFMEYSMASFYKDYPRLEKESVLVSEQNDPANRWYVLAADDIMTYEADDIKTV